MKTGKMTSIDNTESDDKGWLLKEMILKITHRWDILFIFLLTGGLVGGLISYLLPSQYQASRNIYVGLNAYRFADDSFVESLAGQPFRFADDYKDWQMEQLNDLALSEEFIHETLDLLLSEDPDWQSITVRDFREMADLSWRNVGEWRLVVNAGDSSIATKAVLAWEEILLARVEEAIGHARRLVSLDVELKQLAETKYRLDLRRGDLDFVQNKLSGHNDDLKSMPEGSIIPSRTHSNIMSMVSRVADRTLAWDRILDEAPAIGSTVDSVENWISEVDALIKAELTLLPSQIASINDTYTSLSEHFSKEAAMSYGLASTLVVEADEEISVDLEIIRKKGVFILVGAIIGLLGWILWGFKTTYIREIN